MFEAHCCYQCHYRIKPLPAHCTVHSPDVVLLEERPSSMGVYIYFTFVVEYCASEIPSHYSIGRIFCFVLFTRVNDGCVVFILILHYRHRYCIALNENGFKKMTFLKGQCHDLIFLASLLTFYSVLF